MRRGLRPGSDCRQVPQRMSAPTSLSDCFGAAALSLKGRNLPLCSQSQTEAAGS